MSDAERHYVYIIGREEGPVKVGISNRPWARLGSIKTSCPFPVKLLYCHPFRSREHALWHEKNFHVVYRDKRLSGEWFDVDLELAIEGVECAVDTEYHFQERALRGEVE